MKTNTNQGVIKETVMLLGRMLIYFKPWIWVYFPCMLIWASQDFLGNYIMALLQRNLLASITEGGGLSGVLNAILIFLLMIMVFLLVFSIGLYTMTVVGEKVKGSFQAALFSKLLRQPQGAHTGDGLSRLVNDAVKAMDTALWQFGFIFMALIAIIGSAWVIYSVDWRLGVLAICLGIVFMMIDILFTKPMRDIGQKIQEHTSFGNQRLLDVLAGALTIRLFSLASNRSAVYRGEMDSIWLNGMKRVKLNTVRTSIGVWQGWLSFAGVFGIGCIFVARGEITLPNLVLVSNMLGQVIYKFTLLSETLPQIQQGMAAANRVFEVIDAPCEDLQLKEQKVVNEGDIAFEFKNVTFAYDDERDAVLKNISLSVKKGEIVALVGGSGSGKTTVFKLLLGMMAPQTGQLYMWGKERSCSSLVSWRNQLAYVSQEASLFDGTIAENIAMGKLDATQEEITQAAQSAYAMEFIQSFPDGLESQTGEMGGKLSGGQRQRIAIARALVRDAPILLLDEATSSLDSESETEVQKAINNLIKGRTVLVAAHRLSTIRYADRILVLEKGHIIEEGKHEDLLALNGTYSWLWKTHAGFSS